MRWLLAVLFWLIPLSASAHESAFKKQLLDPDTPDVYLRTSLDLDYRYVHGNYWDRFCISDSRDWVYEFRGLEDLVVRQIDRIATKFYRQELRSFWEENYDHPLDKFSAQRRYYGSLGRSWHTSRRHWFDSLPAEKGGIETQVIEIGQTLELFSIGPLRIFNTGKIKLNELDLAFDQKKEVDDQKEVEIALEAPPAIYNHPSWSLDFKLKANLRINSLENNATMIRAEVKFKTSWIMVRVRAESRPFRGEAELSLLIVLWQL